jgi:hypothetical protein
MGRDGGAGVESSGEVGGDEVERAGDPFDGEEADWLVGGEMVRSTPARTNGERPIVDSPLDSNVPHCTAGEEVGGSAGLPTDGEVVEESLYPAAPLVVAM